MSYVDDLKAVIDGDAVTYPPGNTDEQVLATLLATTPTLDTVTWDDLFYWATKNNLTGDLKDVSDNVPDVAGITGNPSAAQRGAALYIRGYLNTPEKNAILNESSRPEVKPAILTLVPAVISGAEATELEAFGTRDIAQWEIELIPGTSPPESLSRQPRIGEVTAARNL